MKRGRIGIRKPGFRKWKIEKAANGVVWLLILTMGLYILGSGVKLRPLKKAAYVRKVLLQEMEADLRRAALQTLYPGLVYAAGDRGQRVDSPGEWLLEQAVGVFPLYSFLAGQRLYTTEIESTAAYEILIQGGVHDENEINQETGEAFDLAEQVEGIAGLDFTTALTISIVCAWVLWLLFFAAAVAAVGKTSRKRRKGVV